MGPALLGKAVEEGVGGRIVGLAGAAEYARRGGEGDEQGQVEACGQFVQVGRAVDLGTQYRVEPLGRHRRDHSVVEHTGGVHHAGQRPLLGDRGEDRRERIAVGDVAGGEHHVGAGRRQFVRQFPHAGCGRTATAHEHQASYAVLGHEVACHQGAERAGGAGDEHRSVPLRGLGHGQDDLADVAGLGQVTERLRGVAHVPRTDRERLERAALEEREDLGQQLADPIGPGLDQVERLVGDAGERLGHRVRVTDVGLAHLHEPAAARQQSQRGVHELPGEGVQDDVDAASFGGVEEPALEVEGAGRGDVRVVEPEGTQHVPLAGARRAVDLGPQVPGELHGGHADAAGRGMYEDGLPGPQSRQVDQRVVGGHEDDRGRCRFGEGPAVRDPRQGAAVGHRHRAEPAGEETHDAVPGRESGDAGADLKDDTGALDAHGGVAGVHAERDQYVTEVDARGAHADPDRSGGERPGGVGARGQGEVVQSALLRDVEPPRAVAGRGHEGAVGRDAGEPRHEDISCAQGQLGLARGQRRGQHGVRVVVSVEVDQDQAAGVLGLCRADQPPGRGTRRVGHFVLAARRDGAAGRDDERGVVGEARVGQPLLDQREQFLDVAAHTARQVGRRLGGVQDDDGVDVRGHGGQVSGRFGTVGHRPVRVAEHRPPPGGLVRGRRRHGQRRPCEVVQLVRLVAGRRQLLGGHRTQHQGVHAGHGCPGAVGDLQADARRRGGDPHPQRGGTHRVQRHSGPGEGQTDADGLAGVLLACVLRTVQAQRVQGGVEQCGVEPEPVGVRAVGQRDLGEDLLAAPPCRAQPLEHRPVAVATLRQVLVVPLDGNRNGVPRRPHGRLSAGGGIGGDDIGRRQHACCVLPPRRLVVPFGGPRVQGDGTPPVRVLRTDRHLNRDSAAFGQHQGRLQRQLF
ncbi:hypothetical protein EES42_39070 [Streptomyces sp. ADI95-17]|nr:hypothetical protein EES42_39070 [Streptomyces sp. ADI95-17]